MELLIGRDPAESRLQITADGKVFMMGQPGSVPSSVSRQNHCKITIDPSGTMNIENVKEQNYTYVEGQEICSKRINANSRVELGKNRYPINVEAIIKAISAQNKPQVQKSQNEVRQNAGTQRAVNTNNSHPTTYSLNHLERVWEEYDEDMLRFELEEKTAAVQSKNEQRMKSSESGVIGAIPVVGGILRAATLLHTMGKIDTGKDIEIAQQYVMRKRERKRVFEQTYVCPNPDCNAFKGYLPYITLRNKKACDVCGCKYIVD